MGEGDAVGEGVMVGDAAVMDVAWGDWVGLALVQPKSKLHPTTAKQRKKGSRAWAHNENGKASAEGRMKASLWLKSITDNPRCGGLVGRFPNVLVAPKDNRCRKWIRPRSGFLPWPAQRGFEIRCPPTQNPMALGLAIPSTGLLLGCLLGGEKFLLGPRWKSLSWCGLQKRGVFGAPQMEGAC